MQKEFSTKFQFWKLFWKEKIENHRQRSLLHILWSNKGKDKIDQQSAVALKSWGKNHEEQFEMIFANYLLMIVIVEQ